MRSSSGGLLTTLLMFVPLIAVPALAIFGVPNSGGLKASLDPNAAIPPLDLDREPSLGGPIMRPSGPADSEDSEGFLPTTAAPFTREGWADPFLGVSSHLKDDGANGSRPGRDRAADGRRGAPADAGAPHTGANAPTRLEPDRKVAMSDSLDARAGGASARGLKPPVSRGAGTDRKSDFDDPGRDLKRTAENTPASGSAAAGDWRSAVRRLKELGISEYQLVPGEADNGFLFTCQCQSPDSPRIIHRFEAEAAEPFEAVQDVLGQVERWLSRR